MRPLIALVALLLAGCDASPAQTLYLAIESQAKDFMVTIYTPLTESFQPIAEQLMFVMLILVAWSYIEQKPKPLFHSLIAMLLATSFMGTTAYMDWVYTPIISASEGLAQYPIKIALHGSSGDVFATMQNHIVRIGARMDDLTAGLAIYDTDFWAITLTFGISFLMLCVLYVLYLVMILLGVIALHLLLIPGGIMIALAAPSFSRHIFYAWLRMIATYALIPFFASLIMAFSMRVLFLGVDAMAKSSIQNGVMSFEIGFCLIATMLCVWMMSKAPEWASGITGGHSSGMGGVFGMATAGVAAAVGASKLSGADVGTRAGTAYGANAIKGAIDGFRNPVAGQSKPYSAMLGIKESIAETRRKRGRS